MPIPTRAPVIPPIAPPTPTPANVAIIGPAAISGPTPGIAKAPIPASNPSVPPNTAPVPPPAVLLLDSSKSQTLPSSSLPFSSPCDLLLRLRWRHFQLIDHVPCTCYFGRLSFDCALLFFRANRPLQCHLSVLRYDLDVVCIGGKGLVISDGRPDPFRQVAVRRIHLLPIRCWRTLVAVPFIRLAIVGCRLLTGVLPWLRSGHHTTAEQSCRSYENKAFRSL